MAESLSNEERTNPVIGDNIDLLHPEILPVSSLLQFFKERCFIQDQLQDLTRDELVSLYRKTLMPLPQREYRDNRRGKMMRKRQEQHPARKRKVTDSSTDQTPVSPPPVKLVRTQSATASNDATTVSTSSSTAKSSNSLSPYTQDKNNSGRSFNESGRKMIKLINDTLKLSSDSSERKDRHSSKNQQVKDDEDTRQSDCKYSSKNSSDQESVRKKHKPITWP